MAITLSTIGRGRRAAAILWLARAPSRVLRTLAIVALAVAVLCLSPDSLRAEGRQALSADDAPQLPSSIGVQDPRAGSHDDHAHHEAHGGASAGLTYSFTLNVTISNEGIEPSSIFIPAGRRVQLVLRNRGVSEHHYRIVGLVPEDLLWISEPGAGMSAADLAHDDHALHHARSFVRSRDTSPAGITPTGDEVHAYVSPSRGLDIVLFTARTVGTFVVQCDLHPHIAGQVTVFDAGLSAAGTTGRSALGLPGPGSSPAAPSPLRVLLFIVGFAVAVTATGAVVAFAAQRLQ